MTVCPSCLREEFAPAPVVSTAGERETIKMGNQLSLRRASARAERLSDGFQKGTALTPYAALRFVLGVVIFLFCALLFACFSSMEEWQVRAYMPEAAQRPVSILLCWVAAALVFSSSRQNKWLVYPLVLLFVAGGWFMPSFWSYLSINEKRETTAAIAASTREHRAAAGGQKESLRTGRELSEEDLAIYREKKQKEGNSVNYGIYINTRDVGLRQSIRATLARLLEAESCVPYTRGQGSLFIVSRAAGGTRNIARIAARFGDLNHASPAEGIYEVDFKPEKVNAVNSFSSEILSSPAHESFVTANLMELRNLLDPHRVRTAAVALAAAGVENKREEVRRALVEVLRDPWATEPETYAALAGALTVYAAPGDREAVDACRKYFLNCRRQKQVPAPEVMTMLIREVPEEMVAPVVELWCANPVEWNSMLEQLGTRPQEHLLEVLESAESLQLIGSILRYLEHNGTPEAVPAVRKFANHSDSLISRAARATLQALGASEH